MKNPNKLPPDIEGVDKALEDALCTAYYNGRAGNKYIPKEVIPGLKSRLTEHGVVVLDEDQTLPVPEDKKNTFEIVSYGQGQLKMLNDSWRKVVNLDGTPVKEG